MNRKKNSIRILAAGMEQFEAKQQQADCSVLSGKTPLIDL